MDNYRHLVEELAQEDLDQLANARSFSLASMTPSPTSSGHPQGIAVEGSDDEEEEEEGDEEDEDEDEEEETPVNTLERACVPPMAVRT